MKFAQNGLTAAPMGLVVVHQRWIQALRSPIRTVEACAFIRIVKRISFSLGPCSFRLAFIPATSLFVDLSHRRHGTGQGALATGALKSIGLYRSDARTLCGATIFNPPLHGPLCVMRPPRTEKNVSGMFVSAIAGSCVSVRTQKCGSTD